MTQTTIDEIINKVFPGDGNIRAGAAYLSDGSWIVPFRNARLGHLQAFLKDREIVTDGDRHAAIKELSASIGLAIASSQ